MTVPEIQQEIEQTRERLGETVEELAAKVDVRASARQKVAEVKAKTQVKAADVKARTQVKAAELTQRVQQSQVVQRRWPLAVAAGVLVAGSVAVWRRRRKT
jgi:chorismate mutase